MTIEELKALGADTDAGLARCLNNEAFYFRLIGMAAKDAAFEKLESAIAAGELGAAFEAAHSLKGVLGNLSLTFLFEPVSELTEILRAKAQADYAPLVRTVLERRDALRALCEK